MKIMLAVDGSDYTRKMLDYVTHNSALFDASHEYMVFNAQPPLPPHARSVIGSAAAQDYHLEEAQKVITPAVAALQAKGLRVTGEWRVGHPGEAIAQFAESGKFDMLIMGTHGHGALARLVMGSVTSQVLAHCGVPVLLIR
ncbi:MAG TPA: universal stress protein [Ramlibacter sp.]|nr:universal stress protein [Ramlibacter sp.]